MNDESIPQEFRISQKRNETQKMWEFRKGIYENILNKTNSYENAKVYSNIIINMITLDCQYPQEIQEKVASFIPKESENIYKK